MGKIAAFLRDYALPIAQLVGIFFTYLTARSALRAVALSKSALDEQRDARKQERAFRRPYLTVPGTTILHRLEGAPHPIQIKIQNNGQNPAAGIEGEAHLINKVMTAETKTHFSVANDLPGGLDINSKTTISPPGDEFPHYVVLNIEYKDAITGDEFRQTFFFKWQSFPDKTLHHATRDEGGRIVDYLNRLTQSPRTKLTATH